MTLTVLASFTRKFIIFFAIFSFLGIVAAVGYRIWYMQKLASLPPVEEQPDAKWGVLPAPDLPFSDVSSSNYSYSLATTTGRLPDNIKLVKVFFIPQSYSTLLATQKADELSRAFNLNSPPEVISETRYRYSDNERSLILNLDTNNFVYQYQASESASPSARLRPQNSNLIQNFKDFLENRGLLKEELRLGRAEVEGSQIHLWPTDIDEKQIVTPEFKKSLVNAQILTDGNKLDDYLNLNYTFWPVDVSVFSTYPVRPYAKAFDDLKSGKGSVIIKPITPEVAITSAYLAYFQSEKYSPYLQPVYIFEGPSFVAYVPSLDEKFLEAPGTR